MKKNIAYSCHRCWTKLNNTKAQAEQGHAQEYAAPGAQLLHDQPFQRAEKASLDLGDGKGPGHLPCGPTEGVSQHRVPYRQAPVERSIGHGHDQGTGAGQIPAAEHTPGAADDAGKTQYNHEGKAGGEDQQPSGRDGAGPSLFILAMSLRIEP